jgi:hypothetical protein
MSSLACIMSVFVVSPRICKYSGCNSRCCSSLFQQSGGQCWNTNNMPCVHPDEESRCCKVMAVRCLSDWGACSNPFPWKLSSQEILNCYVKMCKTSVLLE